MSNLFERTKPSAGPRILLSLMIAVAGLGASFYFLARDQAEETIAPSAVDTSAPEESASGTDAIGRAGEPIDWRAVNVGAVPSDCGGERGIDADVTLAIVYRMGSRAVGEFALRNTGDSTLYYVEESVGDCLYSVETLRGGAWKAGRWSSSGENAQLLEIEPGETTLVRASLEPLSDTVRVAFGLGADSAQAADAGRASHVHSEAFVLLVKGNER